MRFVVLGSSSRGNCYLLDNGKECLMVECGISFHYVQVAVGFDIRRVVGCLVSHEHGDHSRHVRDCLAAQIPVYASKGTIEALGLPNNHLLRVMPSKSETYAIGGFKVRPFATQHDAAEPYGFLIWHQDCGTVLFATDTYYLHNRFRGLNNILIECNYRRDILERNVKGGALTPVQRDRTIRSHMEYGTCMEMLLANDLSAVNNIVLLHLSDGNSNAAEFQQGIQLATGKRVHVANAALIIENFGKTPF